jgi:hypothetical protein
MCGQTGFGATPGAAQPGMFGGAVPPGAAAGIFGNATPPPVSGTLPAAAGGGVFAPQLQGRDRIAQTLMPQQPQQQPQMPLAQQQQMQRRAQMQRGMPSMGTPDDFVSRTPGPRPFDPTTFMNAFRRR